MAPRIGPNETWTIRHVVSKQLAMTIRALTSPHLVFERYPSPRSRMLLDMNSAVLPTTAGIVGFCI